MHDAAEVARIIRSNTDSACERTMTGIFNRCYPPGPHAILALLLAGSTLLVLAGCEDEAIRSYEAPKAPAYVSPQLQSFSAPADQPVATPTIAWDAPEGWTQSPNASNILFAVYTASTDAGDVRITVTKLAFDGGGVMSNINRWRGQVGLEPVEDISQQPMTTVEVDELPVGILDLASEQSDDAQIQRMLVALMPRPVEDMTWYFKMTGSTAAIDFQKDNFVAFVESVRFEAPTSPEAGAIDEQSDAEPEPAADSEGADDE